MMLVMFLALMLFFGMLFSVRIIGVSEMVINFA